MAIEEARLEVKKEVGKTKRVKKAVGKKGHAADGRAHDRSTNLHKLVCVVMCRFVDKVFLTGFAGLTGLGFSFGLPV